MNHTKIVFLFLITVHFMKSLYSQENNSLVESKVKIHQTKLVSYKKLGHFIGSTVDDVYFCSIYKGEMFLKIRSLDLTVKELRSVKLPSRYKKMSISKIFKDSNLIIVESYFRNQKLKQIISFKETFDFNTLKIVDEFAKYHVVDYDNEYNYKYAINKGEYSNKTVKVLGNTLNKDLSLHIIINNGDSLLQKEKLIPLSNINNKFNAFDHFIYYNDGNNIAVVTKAYKNIKAIEKIVETNYTIYDDNVKPKIRWHNYNYIISLISLNEDEIVVKNQILIDAPDSAFIKTLDVKCVGEDSILITGVYSSGKQMNTQGVYSKMFNPSSDKIIRINSFYKLNSEFINKYRTKSELKEMKSAESKGLPYDFFDYSLLKVLERSGGGYVAAIEQNDKFLTYVTEKAGNVIITHTVFNKYHADIYLIYISSLFEVEDVVKIPKRQVQASLSGIYYSTTALKRFGGKTLIVSSDERKKYGIYPRRIISFVVDDKDKFVTQDILHSYENIEKVQFRVSDIWVGGNKMLNACDRYGKSKFVVLDFEDLIK